MTNDLTIFRVKRFMRYANPSWSFNVSSLGVHESGNGQGKEILYIVRPRESQGNFTF